MSHARSMLPLNPREFLILFALVEGELHGYGLVKALEQQSGGDVHIDPANLYRLIKRLKRDGLVSETDRRPAPESANERRRYYAITEFGREVVAAEAERLDKLAAAARERKLISGTQAQRSQ